MATKTVTILVSDLSGEDATGTVPFALDGVTYEIDLTDDEAAQFRVAMQPYVDAARRTGGRRRSRA